MYKQRRAFYKKNGKEWTFEELEKICVHAGETCSEQEFDSLSYGGRRSLKLKWCYDDGTIDDSAMYPWANQNIDHINECTQHEYFEFFGGNQYSIEDIDTIIEGI